MLSHKLNVDFSPKTERNVLEFPVNYCRCDCSPRFVSESVRLQASSQRLPNTVQLEIGWLFHCNWEINPVSDDSIFREGRVAPTPRYTGDAWKSSEATIARRVEGSSGIKIVIRTRWLFFPAINTYNSFEVDEHGRMFGDTEMYQLMAVDL